MKACRPRPDEPSGPMSTVEWFDEPKGDPPLVVDADPAWPDIAREWIELLGGALAPLDVRVEHVGSTVVPSLAAKPVIDLQVVVPMLDDEDAYRPGLESLGLVYAGQRAGPPASSGRLRGRRERFMFTSASETQSGKRNTFSSATSCEHIPNAGTGAADARTTSALFQRRRPRGYSRFHDGHPSPSQNWESTLSWFEGDLAGLERTSPELPASVAVALNEPASGHERCPRGLPKLAVA